MDVVSWSTYALAGGLAAVVLAAFFVCKSRGAVAGVAIPLALLPAAAGWFVAVYQVIQGFRQLALSASTGVGEAVAPMLAAAQTARGTHVASLLALGLAVALAVVGLWTERGAVAAATPRGRSWAVIAASVISMLITSGATERGIRCLALPLPVIALETELDPERIPYTTRALASLDFGEQGAEDVGVVSAQLARALTASVMLSFAACGFLAVSFVMSSILAVGAPLSRSVALAGVILGSLGVLLTLVQLNRLGALQDEIEYISEKTAAPHSSVEPSIGEAVEGSITPPRKSVDVAPTYPDGARAARVEGQVVLEALIDPEGNVTNVKVMQSIPPLDQAAIDAVRQWKYQPAFREGIPVPIVMTVTVTFELD